MSSLVQTLFGPIDSTEPIDVPVAGIVLIAATLTAVPIGIGLWHGSRRDLARRRQAESALRADLARQDERSRIAREMHDVLGHRLSLLSLQAGALEVSDADRDAAEAAQTIRRTARESLDDLRQVIGVLRDGQPSGRVLAPVGATVLGRRCSIAVRAPALRCAGDRPKRFCNHERPPDPGGARG